MVFSLALHFLRERAVAEELAQDVFLELYVHRGEIASAEHARHWLRKVTSRRCIDQTRRSRLRPRLGLHQAPEPFVWLPMPDPMLTQHLADKVAGLTETARMVVILRYQEDLSPTEIGEVLEMPVATVKSHLQRSLANLRSGMEALR